MRELVDFVQGPFIDEAEFKYAVLRRWRELPGLAKASHFQIENEEKEPGMPDCLTIMPNHSCFFTEFKISDKHGVIKFEPTQPPFYKKNSKVPIGIIAYDRRFNRSVKIEPDEVVKAKSLRIKIPEVLNAS